MADAATHSKPSNLQLHPKRKLCTDGLPKKLRNSACVSPHPFKRHRQSREENTKAKDEELIVTVSQLNKAISTVFTATMGAVTRKSIQKLEKEKSKEGCPKGAIEWQKTREKQGYEAGLESGSLNFAEMEKNERSANLLSWTLK